MFTHTIRKVNIPEFNSQELQNAVSYCYDQENIDNEGEIGTELTRDEWVYISDKDK